MQVTSLKYDARADLQNKDSVSCLFLVGHTARSKYLTEFGPRSPKREVVGAGEAGSTLRIVLMLKPPASC